MITLDKCNGSCNAVDDLSIKICVLNKTKSINVKVLNVITKLKKAKTFIKHISCNCKSKFDSTTCNSNQKWNNETCQCKWKISAKQVIARILADAFVKMVNI